MSKSDLGGHGPPYTGEFWSERVVIRQARQSRLQRLGHENSSALL